MAEFASRFRELAARETRVIILPVAQNGLPAAEYGFLEFYCNEPSCDCRRVLIQVRLADAPDTTIATINYGWETEEFYARWLHGDRESAREIRNAELDPLNPQSALAPKLLSLFRGIVLSDPAYIARLKRHYKMFKAAQGKPARG
jgi:hypothetical protein